MPRLVYFGPHGVPKSQWTFWRKTWNAKKERPPTLFPQTWMKVVKPWKKLPPNVVQFECSFQMNKIEIRDYLHTIYNVRPNQVNTMVMDGERYTYMTSDSKAITHTMPHKKIVWATLPRGMTFEYPDYRAELQKILDEKEKEKLELTETDDGKELSLSDNTSETSSLLNIPALTETQKYILSESIKEADKLYNKGGLSQTGWLVLQEQEKPVKNKMLLNEVKSEKRSEALVKQWLSAEGPDSTRDDKDEK